MSRVAEQIHTALEEDLPSGWSLATIECLVGEEGVFVDGDWVESKDQDPTGDVRLIQLADIGDGEYRNRSDRFLTHEKALELGCTFLKKGDVLIARMPDPLGRACIFPDDRKKSVTVVDVAIVRSGSGEFNHRWLMYFINAPAFRASVASLQSGSTRKRISRGNLARISLPVPLRSQQDGIVAEIEKQFSRLDEAVATLKRVKANLKRYKASVLKAAVESKLTEAWRKQHPNVEPASILLERILTERRAKWNRAGNYREPAVPDTTGLPLLPNNWKWASLDQLLLNITDGDHQPPPQTDSGVPFLVIGNVRSGKLEFEDTRFVSRQYADAVNIFRKPTRGDILYTLVGSFGIALRVDADREFCIQRHIGVLRSHKLSPTSYLVHVLNSLFVFSQATNVATGTAQKTVPLAGLRRFSIPLAPLAEQQQIVAEVERRLSVIEELEAAVQANLTRAERMRQSILQQAFSGRLLSASTRSPSLKTSKGIVAETSSFGSSIR